MEIIAKERAVTGMHLAPATADIAHLRLTCHEDVHMTDLSRTGEMIESGYEEAAKWLATVDVVRVTKAAR